jgi:hypothetical protein
MAIVVLITVGWLITPAATAAMDALHTNPATASVIYQLLVSVNLLGLAAVMPALYAFRFS